MTPELAAALGALGPDQPLLVALDFDGTLSHLVAEPGLARPAPGALELLAQLSAAPATEVVLISGRAFHDLAAVSGAADVALLIGSHGQEHGAAAQLHAHEADLLAALRAGMAERTTGICGVRIEDKPAGFAVHVRHCSPDDAQHVVDAARDLAAGHPGVHTVDGKMVIELSVRPLDKGTALRALIEDRPERRVLFAGDDVTDEAAMAVLRTDDVAIKVGDGDTLARFRVTDPDDMVEVLAAVARVRGA